MACKHISDITALKIIHRRCTDIKKLYHERNYCGAQEYPSLCQLMSKETGQCRKVCLRVLERVGNRGLIEYGTSINNPWLTLAGEKLLNDNQ